MGLLHFAYRLVFGFAFGDFGSAPSFRERLGLARRVVMAAPLDVPPLFLFVS